MANVPSEESLTDSVSAETVRLIGRAFWVYRGVVPPGAASPVPATITQTFAALEEEYLRTCEGPIGLALLIRDRTEMQRHPEAIWPETELLFAGYTQDDQQLRIRYFNDAIIGPGLPNSPTLEQTRDSDYPIGESYRIEPLGADSAATADDVLALWKRENVLEEAEARQRAGEVVLVAVERNAGVVGVSTAYVKPNARLRMDAWHIRSYVSEDHRRTNLATQLFIQSCDLLEERFASGEDVRASAILIGVENEGLKTYFNRAVWLPSNFTFIGESPYGAHVRVRYLAGATAPLPT